MIMVRVTVAYKIFNVPHTLESRSAVKTRRKKDIHTQNTRHDEKVKPARENTHLEMGELVERKTKSIK